MLRLAIAALACVFGAGAGVADAAAPLTVTHVDASHFPLVRVTVNAVRPTALKDLTLWENGQQIDDVNLPDVHATTATALAVDSSRSMRGRRLRDVISAASAFVRLQRGNELLAVYGFSAQPYQVSSFSLDRASALSALGRVRVGGPTGTTTYAAIKLIAHDAGPVAAVRKSLVLVTDGQSFRDPATLSDAISAATAARVAIYPVVIVTPIADIKSLSQLAKATGGSLVTASKTSELRRVYQRLSQELGGTYTISYHSRGSWASPNHLEISAPGLGTAKATMIAPRPRASTQKGPSVKAPTSMLARVTLVFGLMLGLGVAAIGSLKIADIVRR
jgi:VWFA-related protein